jgi:hypothetical protein
MGRGRERESRWMVKEGKGGNGKKKERRREEGREGPVMEGKWGMERVEG